jgi:hypothetical protein
MSLLLVPFLVLEVEILVIPVDSIQDVYGLIRIRILLLRIPSLRTLLDVQDMHSPAPIWVAGMKTVDSLESDRSGTGLATWSLDVVVPVLYGETVIPLLELVVAMEAMVSQLMSALVVLLLIAHLPTIARILQLTVSLTMMLSLAKVSILPDHLPSRLIL